MHEILENHPRQSRENGKTSGGENGKLSVAPRLSHSALATGRHFLTGAGGQPLSF